jgi:hypothetical protein
MVAVTVRGPTAAIGETVMFTVAETALLMETTWFTVTPAPKLKTVLLLKDVSVPVTVTFCVAPCATLIGLTAVIEGPVPMVKACAPVATSPKVVMVTVFCWTVAEGATVMFTVASIALLTVMLLMEVPGPKDGTV